MTIRETALAASLALALLMTLPAQAQTAPSLVDEAIASIEAIDIDAWSYTMTSIRGGKKTIERHDASKPENMRWQLLLKNDESPTADQLAEYTAAKAGQRERRQRRGRRDREEIRGMIDAGSIVLVREDAARATYSFRMKADDAEGKRIAEHVAGTLVVDRNGPHVERIEMRSEGEIRPALGVRLDEFAMTMRFTRDGESSAVLPLGMTTRVRGRAFLVREIDEDIAVTYSDYRLPERVGGR